MRNPYHYVLGTSTPDSTLQSQYGYEQESPYITELDPGDNHLITQDAADTTVLHFTYPLTYLETKDGGDDIGKTIRIKHPYNGNLQNFPLKLKCNSKPPRPLNPTVMLTDTSENGEFVLCLNLGDKKLFKTAGIHHDVKSISINEDTYNLSFSGDGTVNISSPSNDKLTKIKDDSWQPNEAGSNINFPHESGKNPIYYLSGINKNTPTTFNIVLSDEAGLTTQISVSSSAQTLSEPSLSSGSTALASGGSDINYIECTEGVEDGSLTIRAPTTTTKGEILSGLLKTTCTLEKIDRSGRPQKITFTGVSKTLNTTIQEGEYKITVWSEMSGYLASDHIEYTVYVKPKYTYEVTHLFQNIDNDGYVTWLASYPNQTYTIFKGQTTQAEAYTNITGFDTPTVTNSPLMSQPTDPIEIKYDRKTFSLTYNKNAGADLVTVPDRMTYKYGKEVDVVFTSTRTGYNLKGWATTSNATTPRYKDTSGYRKITITQDTILFAVWEAKSYTLTFDKNAGTDSATLDLASKTVKYDSPYGVNNQWPSTPTRTGYTFDGWYTSLTPQTTDQAVTSDTTYRTDGNQKLYAKWKLNYHKVIKGSCTYGSIGDAAGTKDSSGNFAFGTEVTVVLTPEDTFVVDSIQVKNKTTGGNLAQVSRSENGVIVTIKFTMPDSDVEINPVFAKGYTVRISLDSSCYNINQTKGKYVKLWIVNTSRSTPYTQATWVKRVKLDENGQYYGSIPRPYGLGVTYMDGDSMRVFAISTTSIDEITNSTAYYGFGYADVSSNLANISLQTLAIATNGTIHGTNPDAYYTPTWAEFLNNDGSRHYNNFSPAKIPATWGITFKYLYKKRLVAYGTWTEAGSNTTNSYSWDSYTVDDYGYLDVCTNLDILGIEVSGNNSIPINR